MGETPLIFRTLSPGPVFFSVLAGIYAVMVALRLTTGRRMDPEAREKRIAMAESAVLSVILFAMILFSVLQIVLRNVFRTGLLWVDPMLRWLVLWIGILGAYAATRHLRHIAIDVLGRLLPEAMKPVSRAVTSVVAFLACVAVANASWAYVRNEVIFGSTVFLGIPSWIPAVILVFGFAAMGWRFLEWVLWPRTGGPGRPPFRDEFGGSSASSAATPEAPPADGAAGDPS